MDEIDLNNLDDEEKSEYLAGHRELLQGIQAKRQATETDQLKARYDQEIANLYKPDEWGVVLPIHRRRERIADLKHKYRRLGLEIW